jgi:glycerol-3-phosphate acyltransferase PlsY
MSPELFLFAILIFFLSYFIGSIPFSYLIANLYKKDLYKIGSKNIGTANVWRATGKIEATFLALVGDVGKGFFPLYLLEKTVSSHFLIYLPIFQSTAAFGAVLGHNFPIYLKFKGGRGLATLAGALIYINWKIILIALISMGFFIFLTEFVSKRGKIDLEGNLRAKVKKLFTILISQVLGRMIGILVALVVVFFIFPLETKIILPAVVLTGLKHIKRTKDFLKKTFS